VDSVPYNETRNYVKNVMAFTAVYAHRLETTVRRLTERMPRVLPGGVMEDATAATLAEEQETGATP
jgi:hypothetical protein